ncbi:MAG: SEC-C domain-containing protein [Deltaproteobacteria bacterium]|nr:SEC-C domain-containing protein [Deltaproteobacteria bacterium]
MNCPCGSASALESCCGRYHRGAAPPTAEALMRARYAAYATGVVDFLASTGVDSDRAGIAAWCSRAKFLGLVVESKEAGGETDSEGFVTFRARFVEGGKLQELRERSRFERREGRWNYVGGDGRVSPVVIGRNDPCPCGSGEKFKKCHG